MPPRQAEQPPRAGQAQSNTAVREQRRRGKRQATRHHTTKAPTKEYPAASQAQSEERHEPAARGLTGAPPRPQLHVGTPNSGQHRPADQPPPPAPPAGRARAAPAEVKTQAEARPQIGPFHKLQAPK